MPFLSVSISHMIQFTTDSKLLIYNTLQMFYICDFNGMGFISKFIHNFNAKIPTKAQYQRIFYASIYLPMNRETNPIKFCIAIIKYYII